MKRLAIAILFLTTCFLAVKAARDLAQPVGLRSPVTVEVLPGAGTQGIATQLESAGIVRSRWPFLTWHFLHPSRPKLKAGEYVFEGTVDFRAAYSKIARGDVYYHPLAIPEGFNMFDVAAAVDRSGLASAANFLAAARNTKLIADLAPEARSLEGFLFPDTYFFSRHTTAAQIVQAMVARFRKVYGEVARDSHSNPLAVATLASLVEKETGKPNERPLIAGVLENRLSLGMPLQCDPAVVYAALLEGAYRGAIYASDLRRASPYNTYVTRGLPPGPIANPGRASLEAAAHPAHTDFLYFVADTEGGHIFSRTLAEHSRRVSGYRRKAAAHVHG